ncbi:MAG: alanine--tRNA ligase, partial [Lachnospiraceae bacterium]|nr:alanine--tRNA ligase [Lachnospiraceae bacterium]
LATAIPDVDMNGLRNLGDEIKAKLGECIVILGSNKDGKVSLLAMATDEAMKAGAHAGNIIKAIAPVVGGGGGGRPNMAQAGGKSPEKLQDAINESLKVIESML